MDNIKKQGIIILLDILQLIVNGMEGRQSQHTKVERIIKGIKKKILN